MAFCVHRSNRTERLADALADVLDQPLADPFAPERVVVPSRGMAQWVSLALADRTGVAAHLRFQTPREAVESLLGAGAPADVPAPWDRELLAWAVLDVLRTHRGEPALASLGGWLGDDVVRTWELSRRVAHVFDQYAAYRPELVVGWSAGADDGWESWLWRAVEAKLGVGHVAGRVGAWTPDPEATPRRLCAFGLTTLPPLYLDVLARVAEHAPVHLFVLSPSREFWADTRPLRDVHAEIRRGRPRLASGEVPPVSEAAALLHHDIGHPLLASLGRVGRELQQVLEARVEYVDDDAGDDLFVDPGSATALRTLQSDMLALRARAVSRAGDTRAPLSPDDRSLVVLGCHSPMRELEVLRDRLWDMFAADRTLGPRDVAILVPDVSEYGALVDAVFGVDVKHPLYVPYHLADRRMAEGNAVAAALLAVLDRVGGRETAPELLDLLSLAPVREHFGFGEAELADVAALVREAAVRWGRDAAHRAAVDQPDVDAFTWRLGLERLLLGHAVGGEALVAGRVPVAAVEGEVAERVGRLSAFAEAVFALLDELRAPRTPEAWAVRLQAWLDAWCGGEAWVESAQVVRARLAELTAACAAGGFSDAVPLDVMRRLLRDQLSDERRTGGFLRGGMTVCEMLPMRAVPFRVIALVGMSDGVFPRADASVGFDRIARAPRAGDRSKRNDDRYLVLEALLSARDALLVTYVSRGVSDNRERPPSVVLSDLLDAVDATFVPPEGMTRARDALVVHHPLQPWSLAYVRGDDARLRTWDADAVAGAGALAAGGDAPLPSLGGRLVDRDTPDQVDLDTLCRLVRDPVQWFLESRLGLRDARHDEDGVDDTEPLAIRELEAHALGERVLELLKDHVQVPASAWQPLLEQLRGEGRLPLGNLAQPALAVASRRVTAILRVSAVARSSPRVASATVDVEVGDIRVVGRVEDLRPEARVVVGYADVSKRKASLILDAWVRHVALCAHGDGARPVLVFGRKGDQGVRVVELPVIDVDLAHEHLAGLVSLWRDARVQPLPFQPEASWKVAAGDCDAQAGVGEVMEEPFKQRNPHVARWRRVFGETPERDPDVCVAFAELAERVLAPVVALVERA